MKRISAEEIWGGVEYGTRVHGEYYDVKEVDAIVECILSWPDGGNECGQEKIKAFLRSKWK